MASVEDAPVLETMKSAVRPGLPDRRNEACVVHIYPKGPLLGRRYPLGDASVLVGRNEDCLVQNTDASVSRYHARIEFRNGTYHVTDLGSTNRTFINRKPLMRGQPYEIHDGDEIRLGNIILKVILSDELSLG